ncbi:hypothetical protein [Aeromicrobium alkaliterrae]|uniref:Uncharacterized protein n=1 Tax=Aeromicrobium alkaliterrae TaxID=302168 RepID=A0ABP4VSX0_9ACTN
MDPWGVTAAAYLVSLLGAAGGGPACLDLATLDLHRSAAISSGSADELTTLFVDEAAAASEVAVLQQWNGRGLVLESAMLVIGSCVVVDDSGGRVVLEVVDRLAPTRAIDDVGLSTALPRDDWSRRTVVIQDVDGQWRYAGGSPATGG